MIPTFAADDVVVRDEHHVIYRSGASIGLELFGIIDDVASQSWRDALESELIRAGHPDFYAIDGSRMQAQNGPGSRVRTAMFVHGLMRRAQFALVFGSTKTRSKVVMSAVLRMVGVRNARVVSSEEEFAAAMAELRARSG